MTPAQALNRAFLYLQHRLHAVNEHSLHSPFLFNWYLSVVKGSLPYRLTERDQQVKHALLRDHAVFTVKDFGAGGYKKKSVSEIIRREELPDHWRHLLARMMAHHQPVRVLELGTSLGLTTLLFAASCPEARICTVEGDAATAAKARHLFAQQGRADIELLEMPIEEFLKSRWLSQNPPDFVFVDANHRYAPTVAYVEAISPFLGLEAVLVLDDINWSMEMHKAWNKLRQRHDFQLSLDLGRMGVLMKKKGILKQHFRLRG